MTITRTGKLIICILLFSTATSSYAWEKSLKLGFGNFQAFNAAMHYRSAKLSLEYGYGNDLNIYGQGFYNCAFGSIGRPMLQKWVKGPYRLNLHFRVLVWNLENKSNIFSAVAFTPKIELFRKLGTRYAISVYGGYSYSSVFRYKRKSYFEIGWPKEWLPDFGISIQYCLTCK